MNDTWGNLTQEDVVALRSQARTVSDVELEERFPTADGVVHFRIIRKTARAMAGPLDIDLGDVGTMALESAGAETLDIDQALNEAAAEYELAEVMLIPAADFDYTPDLTETDRTAAAPIDASVAQYSGYFAEDKGTQADMTNGAVEGADLPAIVDHQPSQSPVKDQGGRGTCVAHASMGLLEAFSHIPDDLSEQYTHYKFNVFSNQPHNVDSGLKTTDAAVFLARGDGRICLENEWPYIPNQATINQLVAQGVYGPPQAAVGDQTYGIGAYKIIQDKGLTGDSIKNTRYLEALLAEGYNIVVGVWVSWDDKDNNGILDPVLTSSGQPIGKAGHAMLIVGYNRTEQYFIVKNSWQSGWGHNGYGYFHYNFIRSCAKYGFVVDSVAPGAPPLPLPAKLKQAPFSTSKLSRPSLRASVVFFKTSKGRFAVAELYAGDNLLLRNIRVYNADGSMHKEQPSLTIRGTYLCDLDTVSETANDADFWWEAVRPGENYLVPRNGAGAWIAYDLAALNAAKVSTLPVSATAVASANLRYAVIAGRTTTNRRFKILAHTSSDNTLLLSYIEVYNPDGTRYKYATNISVPPSWTYNLDTLQLAGGSDADLWWHIIGDKIGFLETYSTAKGCLVWSL